MKYILGCAIAVLVGTFLLVMPIVMFLSGMYNNLVSQKIEAETQQAQIETQMQRRFDLVPNLVSTVKGAMKQEETVFKDIADARTHYAGSQPGTPDKIQAGQQYESAIGRLLVVMENYPQLKSLDVVQGLMTELEGTENRISVARQRYNEAVQVYNRTLQSFPTNIIGGMMGFKDMVLFQSVTGANVAPKVDFVK